MSTKSVTIRKSEPPKFRSAAAVGEGGIGRGGLVEEGIEAGIFMWARVSGLDA
jgi:hypothetical protein